MSQKANELLSQQIQDFINSISENIITINEKYSNVIYITYADSKTGLHKLFILIKN